MSRGKAMVEMVIQRTQKQDEENNVNTPMNIINSSRVEGNLNVKDFSNENEGSSSSQGISDLQEDSDCSVRDKDFVPETDSSDEDSSEDPVINKSCSMYEENPDKKRTRWKKSDPSQWKKNIMKRRKIEMKKPKPIDCSKCRFRCTDKISWEMLIEICKNYWNCEFSRRKDFILNNVESDVPVRRKVVLTSNRRPRINSKRFFFQTDTKIRVCKSFSIKTLCISKEVIEHAFQNKGDGRLFSGGDKRGKHEPSNKTKPIDVQKVRDHIERFPVMESHYTRQSTKRLYLDAKLSISKMYSLYKEQCDKELLTPVSRITYRRIFCTNYNFSFYKPKKDQCQICMQYRTCNNLDKKEKLEDNFQTHVVRKEDCYKAKIRDKERALKEKNFVCCTFDLQCVLQIPSSDVSPMYYSRKMCTYNLTIYEMAPPNSAFCYVWTELNGKRGSLEIGTCLYSYINQLADEVTELSLFSDTCSGHTEKKI